MYAELCVILAGLPTEKRPAWSGDFPVAACIFLLNPFISSEIFVAQNSWKMSNHNNNKGPKSCNVLKKEKTPNTREKSLETHTARSSNVPSGKKEHAKEGGNRPKQTCIVCVLIEKCENIKATALT